MTKKRESQSRTLTDHLKQAASAVQKWPDWKRKNAYSTVLVERRLSDVRKKSAEPKREKT